MREHRLPRIYLDSNIIIGEQINLQQSQAHYLFNVMRRKSGDEVLIFNSEDGEFKAEIVDIDKRGAVLIPTDHLKASYKSPNITLAYSPLKNVKDEFVVQKATELGVSKIIPVILKNTVKPKVKSDRLGLVAIEAVEQCERFDVPEIYNLIKFDEFLDYVNDGNKTLIFCDETGGGGDLFKVLGDLKNIPKDQEFIVIIGPEGGFDKSEIETIYNLTNSFGIGLGPRILRADTAIITALALVQNYLGDFSKKPDFRKDIG